MTMRPRFLAVILASTLALPAMAQEIRVGLLFAIKRTSSSGEWEYSNLRESVEVIEHLFREASGSGLLPPGMTLVPVLQDSGCDEIGEPGKITSLAEALVVEEAVSAIITGECWHVDMIVSEITAPNAIPLISLDQSSSSLVPAELGGMFQRIAPMDYSRQARQLARILLERGIRNVAVLFEQNFTEDEADDFVAAFEAGGGVVSAFEGHKFNDGSIAPVLSVLSTSGARALVLISTDDKAVLETFGSTEVQQSFVSFGMLYPWMLETEAIADALAGERPLVVAPGFAYNAVEFAPGIDPDLSSRMTSYEREQRQAHDAAALLILALAKAGSIEGIGTVMQEIANAPGERILAGDLKRGLEIIARGGEIDFVGATGVELLADGNPAGNYDETELRGDEFVTIRALPQD